MSQNVGRKLKSRKKTWRCFHCDEVFHSRKAAWAHFGPNEFEISDPPACVDPLRADEKERLTELKAAQYYAQQCQESEHAAEEKADQMAWELDEFKRLTECDSVHALRMKLDSQQGELITARALIEAVRTKAPTVYEEVIQ